MTELSTIESLVLAYAPGLVAFIGVIIAFCKLVRVINNIRLDNKLSNAKRDAEITSLKNDIKSVLNENYELKKTLREYMSKIDHIRRD
jgi:hypothetical protein